MRCLVVSVVVLALAGSAAAQPSLTEPVPRPTPRQQRYGGWMAAADLGGTLAITVIGASTEEEAFWWVWVGSYLGTGPLVHASRGENGKGLGSLVLRVSTPVLFAWVGYHIEEGDGGELDGLGGILLGGATGIVTAWVIDWTVLAKTDVDVPLPGHVIVTPTDGGATFGLAGRF